MLTNPVIEAMKKRKSIRSYTSEQPSDEVLNAIVAAGQQAPFAAQLGSLLLKRDVKKNPFKAPWLFTVCIDLHRMETIMKARGWSRKMSDLGALILGVQDAAYVAENMVIAAESLGLGSCYLGATPMYAKTIIDDYGLPPKVFPLVQLTMGYPAEAAAVRPRYPMGFTLFEDRYPQFTTEEIARAMRVMDDGYLAQDYYRSHNAMIPLADGSEETFTYGDYSWTEHISRKLGQWGEDPSGLMNALRACGFFLDEPEAGEAA